MKKTVRAFVLCTSISLLGPPAALASGVFVDFDSTPEAWGYGQEQNVTISGIRFSPSYHVDIGVYGYGENDTVVLGWDMSGDPNPEYLGPTCSPYPDSAACVLIDNFGGLFSLTSFLYIGETVQITSSKGGFLEVHFGEPDPPPETYQLITLAGPEWQGVQWLQMGFNGCGGPCQFVDDLYFEVVPIPAAAWLLGSALGVLTVLRRRAIA